MQSTAWSVRLPSSGLIDRLRRVAPWLLAVILLCVFLALLVWQALTWLELTGAPDEADTVTPPSATTTPDLERLNILFGTPAQPDQPAQGSGPTSIVLHGSFTSADPQQSSAVLQVGDQPPRRYRVGEELMPGVVLHGVEANRVQLRRNGRRETLAFPRSEGDSATFQIEPPEEPLPAEGELAAPIPEAEMPPTESSGPPPGVLDPPPEAVPDVPGERAP